jgi:hypothetical protein
MLALLSESMEAVTSKTAQALNVESRIRGVGMAPPRQFDDPNPEPF